MSRQQDVDELFEIRNYFYIGNYQQYINEAQKLRKPSSADVAVERDIFMYRAYMAQSKFLVVLDDIKPSSPEKLQPLRLLADYLANKSKRDGIVSQLDQKLTASANVENEVLILVAAIIYQRENNSEMAFRLLHTIDTLDAIAILDILLKINRVDLATSKLSEMREKDDDATLTQLAQAWVFCASGKDDLRNAYYIYQDLIDKYGSTPLLLNGQAVTYIAQNKFEEAESALLEALDKDPNYADTSVNLIVLSQLTAKSSEVANRYLAQLKDSHPDHSFLKERDQKEREFENICKQYAPSVGRS